MEKTWSKLVLAVALGALWTIFCIFVSYNAAVFDCAKKADTKRFVDDLIQCADEASADFEESGFVFEEPEERPQIVRYINFPRTAEKNTNVLKITTADGWRFYYETSKKRSDRLIKIEGSVEAILWGEKETVTADVEIEWWSRKKARVEVDYVDSDGRSQYLYLLYRIPEFDDFEAIVPAQADIAGEIQHFISIEQLSALYKSGKELEEILSEYCTFKDKNKNINIGIYYEPLYKSMGL